MYCFRVILHVLEGLRRGRDSERLFPRSVAMLLLAVCLRTWILRPKGLGLKV